MRCLYTDLDGTLLGAGASLFRAGDGSFSLDAARLLQVCDRAGVEVVLFSGRIQAAVSEDARLIGQRSYIFELGCGLVLDGELEWLMDGVEPDPDTGTVFEQIEATGAAELLIEHFSDRLEPHTPWSRRRDVSHLLRGDVDIADAHALLAEHGLDWLRVVDNGVITERSARLAGLERIHCYPVTPAGASKARAVARHMQNRGYAPEDCIATGDSREDLAVAPTVGCFWLVANALTQDPDLAGELSGRDRVRVAEGSNAAGVYEAVVTTLAGG